MKRTLLSVALLSAFGLLSMNSTFALEVSGNSSLSQVAPSGTVDDGLYVTSAGVLDGEKGVLSVSGLSPTTPQYTIRNEGKIQNFESLSASRIHNYGTINVSNIILSPTDGNGLKNEKTGVVIIDRLKANTLTNKGTATINDGFDGRIENAGGTLFYKGSESLGSVDNRGKMYVSSGTLIAESLKHNEYSSLKKNENENLDVLAVIGRFSNAQSTVEVNDLISVGIFENTGAVVKTKKLMVSESFKTTDQPVYQIESGNFIPTASLVEVEELEITGKEASSSIGDKNYKGNYSSLSQLVIHNKLTLSNAHTLNNYAGLYLTGEVVTVEGDGTLKNQTVYDKGNTYTGVIAKDEKKNAVTALKILGTLENTGELYARTLEVEKGFDSQEGKDTGVFEVDNLVISQGGDFTLNRSETNLQTVTLGEGAKLTAEKTVNLTGDSFIANNGGVAKFGLVDSDGLTVLGKSGETTIAQAKTANQVDVTLDKGSVTIGNLEAPKLDITMNSLDGKLTVTDSADSLDASVTISSQANKGAPQEVFDKVMESVAILKDGQEKVDYLVSAKPGTITDGWTANSADPNSMKTEKNPTMDAMGSVTALSALTLRHEMNSLTKRMGELRDAPAGVGVWARAYGSEMEFGDQSVKAKNNSVQIGADYTLGDWKVGATFSYTDGESSYDAGKADNKNYGLAVYGTWFVPCGAYVDLMAKYTRMDNDFTMGGLDGSFDNNAFNVSAETGYRFNFMDGGVFVEPQVGLSYGFIKGEKFSAGQGVTIEQDDYNSLIGRVGVRTGFKFPKDKGMIYARVSGVYDFDGEINAHAYDSTSSNTIESDLGGAWLEMGVGANFNWTKNTYTYVDFERTNGGDVKENYRWNVGVRHNF